MADYSAMSDRELDAAVAEMVFGWRWIHEDGEQPYAVPYLVGPGSSVYYPTVHAKFPNVPKSGGDLLNYSTDIAAAWEVVEKMRTNGWFFSLADSIELPDFIARFTTCPPVGSPIPDHSAMNVSAPLAICLAALRAVGVSEQEIEAAMKESAQ